MTTTAEALREIEQARTADDLFGRDHGDLAAAHRAFRALAALSHPDRFTDAAARERATRAFARLTALYDTWRAPRASVLVAAGRRYTLGAVHAKGSVATLYLATDEYEAPVIAKVPRRPRGSGLLEAERDALRALAALTDHRPELVAYFPTLLDSFRHRDAAGAERRVNILRPLTDGFVTLAEVLRAYPGGLDGCDYAWMHRRLLRCLAGARQAGLVHGAVLPDNILIHPARHGVVLVGWTFAVPTGTPLAGMVASQADSYPPEARDRQPVRAESDVYQAHALMLRALGRRAEPRAVAFARGCMQERPGMRPDAVSLLDEYDELLDELYGPRTFRPFTVPTRDVHDARVTAPTH
jgi:serine/threonine protein kinase